jgi:hypothetical protein
VGQIHYLRQNGGRKGRINASRRRIPVVFWPRLTMMRASKEGGQMGRSILFWAATCCGVAGCGMMSDVSETRKQVVQTNKKMDEMIVLLKDTSATTKDMAGKLDKTNTNMSEMLKLLAETNATTRDMGGKLDRTNEQMGTLSSTMNEMKAAMEDMKASLRDTIDRMKEMNGSLVATKEISAHIDMLNGKMLEKMDEMYDEAHRTREGLEKETLFKLAAYFKQFTDVARDINAEVLIRTTMVGALYRFIEGETLPAEVYALLTHQMEMCERGQSGQEAGELCSETFMGTGDLGEGKTFRTETRGANGTIHHAQEWLYVNRKIPFKGKLVRLRPNTIFALSLSPEFTTSFHDKLVGNPKLLARAVAIDFLRFSRRFMSDSIYYLSHFLETDKPGINTAFLLEIERREQIALTIMGFKDIPAAPNEKTLKVAIDKFLEAVKAQPGPISDDDREIINRIAKMQYPADKNAKAKAKVALQ